MLRSDLVAAARLRSSGKGTATGSFAKGCMIFRSLAEIVAISPNHLFELFLNHFTTPCGNNGLVKPPTQNYSGLIKIVSVKDVNILIVILGWAGQPKQRDGQTTPSRQSVSTVT
jgi:hypothetical protein